MIFKLEDKDEADLESHDLHYVPLTDFDTPHGSRPMGCTAANGLLLLYPRPRDYETPRLKELFCHFGFSISRTIYFIPLLVYG